jgi:hypothetical protein
MYCRFGCEGRFHCSKSLKLFLGANPP